MSLSLLGESACYVATLVIIIMALDYPLKMVGGFQELRWVTGGECVCECQLSLFCVKMSKIQVVTSSCISPLSSSSLCCKVVGGDFLLLSLSDLSSSLFPFLFIYLLYCNFLSLWVGLKKRRYPNLP